MDCHLCHFNSSTAIIILDLHRQICNTFFLRVNIFILLQNSILNIRTIANMRKWDMRCMMHKQN